jgi:hypothetical protein
MHKILGALTIAVFLIPAGGSAQTRPLNDRDGKTPTLTIQLPLAITRQVAALPPASRQQQKREHRWPGRHPVLFGALVGVGVGLGVEAAVIPGASGGEPHSAYIPMFAGTGAGIGALVGLIVSRVRANP